MKNERENKGVSAVIGNLIMACMIVATGTGISNMLLPTLEGMNKLENDMWQFNSQYGGLINGTKILYVYNNTTTYVSDGNGGKTPKVYITFNNITQQYDITIMHEYKQKIFSTSKESFINISSP